MDLSLVFNDVSPWLVLPCIAAGLAYAWFLYRKEDLPGPGLRRLLFGLRAFAVAVIAFLLLSPLLKAISQTVEKPIIVLAQDNSSSILLDKKNAAWYTGELPSLLRTLEKRLQGKYDVRSFHFSERPGNGIRNDFSGKQTDISLLVSELKTRFAGRNLGAVVLASDGIYNKGSNPIYEIEGLNTPFYTLALGDTIPKKDLMITSVDHNQVVFLDNDFRIVINAGARGAAGARSRLRVQHAGETLFSREIEISEDDFRLSLPVDLTASEKGRQKYEVSLQPLQGEITEENNSTSIFVEVLDSRRKILLLAASAHPDLGALKRSLESKEQYQVDIRLAGQGLDDLQLASYSMVILHQLPSAGGDAAALLQSIRQENLPLWYIVGSQTDMAALNRLQQTVAFPRFNGSYNDVFAVPDPDFYLFTIPDALRNRLATLPPLRVPFTEVNPQVPAVTLFSQRIGSVDAGRPLLFFCESGQARSAWLLGEGLWRWRLHDFRLHDDHQAIDELLGKTVQYLAARDDNRRFRLSMPKAIFSENEPVTFSAELYNESYEAVTGPDVRISISDQENNDYPFVFSREGRRYQLNAGVLPVGEYTYTATVKLGEKTHTARGSFVVSPQHAEQLQTTANHQLLFTLAEHSGGSLLYPAEADKLYQLLVEKETISPVIYEQDSYRELINMKWLFFLLIALLTAEWLLRKRTGLK